MTLDLTLLAIMTVTWSVTMSYKFHNEHDCDWDYEIDFDCNYDYECDWMCHYPWLINVSGGDFACDFISRFEFYCEFYCVNFIVTSYESVTDLYIDSDSDCDYDYYYLTDSNYYYDLFCICM